MEPCPYCNGSGKAGFRSKKPCIKCKGTGFYTIFKCPHCAADLYPSSVIREHGFACYCGNMITLDEMVSYFSHDSAAAELFLAFIKK